LFTGCTLVAGALIHSACENVKGAKADKQTGEVLAKVDDVVITVGEFADRINQQSPYVRSRYTSIERKKEFLDNLVRFEVLAKEAERRGLTKDPEVVRTMKQVMIQRLLKDQFDKMSMKDISDDDCRKYYDGHPDEFNKPEEARVSMILVKDTATAKKVLGDARSKGVDNAGYRTLVSEYSTDVPTKERGGDLRYFDVNTKDVPKPIVDAAFKMHEIGENSTPITLPQGVAILKLTGRRKALTRTFDETKEQIRNRLFRDKRQEAMESFVKGLRDKASVKIDEGKLQAVKVEGPQPGQFPGQGVPPPGLGQFHPGAPAVPGSSPITPGSPPGSQGIVLPPPGSPAKGGPEKLPEPNGPGAVAPGGAPPAPTPAN
jgi:peptidyl-prolyl cis-trans isomerase C